MDEKNSKLVSYGDTRQDLAPGEGDLHEPPNLDPDALSEDPTGVVPVIDEQLLARRRPVARFTRLVNRTTIAIVLLVVFVGGAGLMIVLTRKDIRKQDLSSVSRKYGTVELPLQELLDGKNLDTAQAVNVTINGGMQLNGTLNIIPSVQPTGARPGQIYFDKDTNQLAYFNGQGFVFLTDQSSNGIQSLGGATGVVGLGDGIALTNGQLSNSGVLSVQGKTGAVTFTAGPGIILNDTTISNGGVLSVSAGSPNIQVTSDGAGNVTVSMNGAGTGTVASSGGTTGAIPMFTSSQDIEDSIITQSGLAVTIAGSLNLANALSVPNGGTGAASLTTNGVLVGQGTSAISSLVAGGSGLCLLSTAGAPTWGVCPGAGASGVSSLNSLTGALNIANASGSGTTITIDNASTSAKGIASFSGTNFTVTGGAVNTIQNIDSGASPTFAGLNTNSVTTSSTLMVGGTTHALTLQGDATTNLSATNGANKTSLAFESPTATVTYRLQTATAGTYNICTSAGNCTTAGTVTSPGGTTNALAKFTNSQIIGDSIITDNGTTVSVGGAFSVTGNTTLTGDIAVNGGDITSTGALNITPGGILTVGATGQQLILQGNASTQLTATGGGFTTTIGFSGSPTGSVTYNFDRSVASGTYTVCTTIGNCAGAGSGVTTSGGTTNRLAKFSGTQAIANSTISDDGATVATTVDLLIQGGDVTVGVANSQTGTINLAHGSSSFLGSLVQGSLTGNRTYTLPDANGTVCLSSGNCSGSGSSNTLQAAYDAGNTIATTDARNIAFTLSNTTTDSNFTVTAATGTTGYVGIVRADGAGTADPAQLLLIDNLDTDRVQPTGLKIQAAGGGMTTAIDLTDPEIVTAINVAANDVVGTTGNIDFTNFDVTGSNGNIVTPGTLNGQTISSAASLTGTLAVAGNTTLTGDIAVNGGDITSTGALNITPGGLLTVGSTSQQLTLQGDANTKLTVTGNGFNTTLGFTGTASGAVTYNLDRAIAAGTYSICTSVGNCTGSGSTSTLQAAYNAGNSIATTDARDIAFSLSDTTTDSNFTITTASGATGFTTLARANGSGTSDPAQLLLLNNLDTDRAQPVALKIQSAGGGITTAVDASGANITTALSIGANAIVGTTGNIDLTNFDVVGSSGNVTATGTYNTNTFTGSALSFGSASTATIQSASSQALNLTGHAASTWKTDSGNLDIYAANTLSFGNSGIGGTINIATDTSSHDVNIGNAGGGIQSVTIGSQNSSSITVLQGGSGGINLRPNTGNVTIGFTDSTADLLIVDTKNTAGDPTGTAGAIYYNSNAGKFRCYQGGAWADCVNAAATLQTAYTGSTGGTTPEIKLDSTRGGLDIQDADTTLGSSAVLMAVRGPNASGLGTALFSVQGSGATTIQSGNANAFAVKNAAGTSSTFNVDTSSNYVGIGNATASRTLDIYTNDSNITSPAIRLSQAGTGDIAMEYAGAKSYFVGVDASDASAFKVSSVAMGSVLNEAGYHTSGTTGDNGNDPLISATQITTGVSGGTLSSLNYYFDATGGGTFKGAIYNDNGSNQPGTLLASSNTAQTVTLGWNQVSLPGATLAANTKYWIAFRVSSTTTDYGTTLGTGVGNTCWTSYGYANSTWLAPFGTPSGGCTANQYYSVYAVYLTNSSSDSFASSMLRMSDTGATTFASNGSSTSAFQILNGSAVPMFVVDTTNNMIKIGGGDVSPDAAPGLLVLDNKSTSGDPSTAVEGSMYYNASMHQFRCYEVDRWRDCVRSARTSYNYINDFIGKGQDSETDFEPGSGTVDVIAGEAGHPGIVILDTLASSATTVALVERSSAAATIRLGNNDTWRFEGVVRVRTAGGGLSTASQRYIMRAGFLNDASLGDGAHGCFLRYSDNVNSGKWQGVCRSNSVESVCDTGITVAVDTWYRVNVIVNAAGSSVDFRTSGVSRCQITTNIPTAVGRETNWGANITKTVGTTARIVDLDYIDITGDFGTAR